MDKNIKNENNENIENLPALTAAELAAERKAREREAKRMMAKNAKDRKDREKADAAREREYYKTHKKKLDLSLGNILFTGVNYLVFTVFTIACIFPFYYLLINTISDNELVKKGQITLWPMGINFNNYISMLHVSDLGNAYTRHGPYGCGICFCRLSCDKEGYVAQEILVQIPDYNDVL